MRLLIVEDDRMIGESLVQALREASYTVDWVYDGPQADLALRNIQYDLVVLDLGLPGLGGLELLRRVRKNGLDVPVIIVTAREATAARIEGLDAGADDYLVKPFDLDELLARVRALLRRRAGRSSPMLEHGRLCLNTATHECTVNGQLLHLPAREFTLLRALLDRPGDVLSRSQLEEKLYGWGDEVESNAVDVYVYHLRKKLGQHVIKNVRGVGYKIGPAN